MPARPAPLALTTALLGLAGAATAQVESHGDHAHDQAHGHAAAAHGHEALSPIPSVEAGVITGVTAIVVFCIVFAVLALKVWPVITRALDERAGKIRSEIEAAEMAQMQARSALQQYEANLAQARAEAQKMLDHARGEQQTIAADLKARAEVELTALREKAKRDIESAKRAALIEIYNEAGSLASSMAAKILKREISPGDQQRLVQESLTELQASVARGN
jgi:F-type H+-transporting ATPase subunit b